MYELIKVMSEGLIGLDHRKYGYQLWSKCKVRKSWRCQVTGQQILTGDTTFRPVTNGDNRMHRISRTGISILLKRYEMAEQESEGA